MILIVDDEVDIANTFKLALEYAGFIVDVFNDPVKSLSTYKAGAYGLLLLDIRMPRMSGFERILIIHTKVASMIIEEIKNLTHKEFEEISNICLSTFPLENAKHLDVYLNHIYDMLKNDSRYHLYVAIKDRSMIGISLLYIFEELKMALLDYMAVIPDFQQRGIGRKLFGFTNDELNHSLPDNIGMLLEVPKENTSDLDEWLRRKRRIQFYSRLGVKVLKDVNYLLPIQVDGNVEEMYLMIKLSKNMTRISKKSIVDFIDSVYTDVYDYRKDDLLSKTTATMPDVIDIEELRV
jgi:CheY-like chemotaxis protein